MLLLLGALAYLLRRLLTPLRRIEREIEEIEAGRMTELGTGYPRELLGVTTNLNALLRGERERLARYRNAAIAHSFKTPLAVMRNLLGGTHGRELPVAKQLDEQVGRMDDIVKYQLKRAQPRPAARVSALRRSMCVRRWNRCALRCSRCTPIAGSTASWLSHPVACSRATVKI